MPEVITIPGNEIRDYAKEASELRAAILGERYRHSSFGSLVAAGQPEIEEKLSDFMKKKKNFLIWLGGTGAGKTHLCGALFEWALRSFSSFRYFKEKDLQEHLRKILIEKGWDTHKELERLFDSDLVFLDDIGKLGHTDHKENMIFDAIDIRYNSMKPTVFTSNLSRSQLQEFYEARLCSRLFAKENLVIEIMDGTDYRVADI